MRKIILLCSIITFLNCGVQKKISSYLKESYTSTNNDFGFTTKSVFAVENIESMYGLQSRESAVLFTENLLFHLGSLGVQTVRINYVPQENEAAIPAVQENNLESNIIIPKKKVTYDYLLSGFVYEKDVGNILEDEHTSGVILTIRDKNGNLKSQLQFVGINNLNSFDESSKISRELSLIINSFKK
jgi:hypothetical protein